MACVTDPLAKSVHGTNPQNLIEYITRQKIYDSQYWKEECFGLSARDVTIKASQLQALGGSYGGNHRPSRFLCLTLKLLQIQPDDDIVEEYIANEDFKYVRALGAFYLRLTGRPAEIYSLLEPLYHDFRKLRYRESSSWKVIHMDELADELLTSDRYCGIALPHLPKREVLVSAGYMEDGPRRSALLPLIEERTNGDVNQFLHLLAKEGNKAAIVAIGEREKRRAERGEDKESRRVDDILGESSSSSSSRRRQSLSLEHDDPDKRGQYGSHNQHTNIIFERSVVGDIDQISSNERPHRHATNKHAMEKNSTKSEGKKKYGTLFKASKSEREKERSMSSREGRSEIVNAAFEDSTEYWNEQRAKLGLKPLQD